MANTPKSRAVIVAGMRTPFVRAFGPFVKMDTIELGKAAVNGLVEKTKVALTQQNLNYQKDLNEVAEIVAKNLAGREKVADAGYTASPSTIRGKAVACARGFYRHVINFPDGQIGWYPYAVKAGSDRGRWPRQTIRRTCTRGTGRISEFALYFASLTLAR